jgi:hypothetical protein
MGEEHGGFSKKVLAENCRRRQGLRHFARRLIFLGIVGAAAASSGVAQTLTERLVSDSIKLDLQEVDNLGNVFPVKDWQIELKASWSHNGAPDRDSRKNRLLLQPRVRLTTKRLSVSSFELSQAKVLKKDDGFEFPLKESSFQGSFIVKENRHSFVARILGPGFLVHESCSDAGIQVFERGQGFQGSYVGISCVAQGGTWEMSLHHGQDLKLVNFQRPSSQSSSWEGSTPLSATPGLQTHRIQISEKMARADGQTALLKFQVSPLSGRGELKSYIVKIDKVKASRWSGSVGLANTFIHYQESLLGITMWGNYFTAKAAGAFALIPGTLSLGANVFGTVAPVFFSNRDRPNPWFIGVNGRIGYTPPWKVWQGVFGINLGYYLWTMWVSDQSYGLRQVAGPQLFLTYGRGGTGVRSTFFYFKFAPLFSGDPGYQFENRDIAVGSSVRINSVRARIPIQLTLDVAHFSITSIAAGNTIRTLSSSIGFNFAF